MLQNNHNHTASVSTCFPTLTTYFDHMRILDVYADSFFIEMKDILNHGKDLDPFFVAFSTFRNDGKLVIVCYFLFIYFFYNDVIYICCHRLRLKWNGFLTNLYFILFYFYLDEIDWEITHQSLQMYG